MTFKTIRNIDVPDLGLGTFELTGEQAVQTIGDAIEIGYRHIDTASKYGNESDVGEGLRRTGLPRNEVFLTTKVWITDCHPDAIVTNVEKSLTALKVDQVDLLLLHWPSPHMSIKTSIEGLVVSLEAGQAKNIGVSNFPPKLLREALNYAELFCNQVEFHPYLNQREVLEIAEEHDMLLTGYAPLAIGRVATDDALIAIGKRHGKSPAQVCLRWILDHERVAAVPKTRSRHRLEENFTIRDFSLTEEESQAIDQLARGLRIYDEEWVADWGDDSRDHGPPLRTVTLPS